MTMDYAEILRGEVATYDGKDADVIKLAPALFDLLASLLEDKRVPKSAKPAINAAISYFVSPYDPFPEDFHGTWGLIDDVVLAAWVLNGIPEADEVLDDHWRGAGAVGEQLAAILARKDELVGDKFAEMLEYVGLD